MLSSLGFVPFYGEALPFSFHDYPTANIFFFFHEMHKSRNLKMEALSQELELNEPVISAFPESNNRS